MSNYIIKTLTLSVSVLEKVDAKTDTTMNWL